MRCDMHSMLEFVNNCNAQMTGRLSTCRTVDKLQGLAADLLWCCAHDQTLISGAATARRRSTCWRWTS